MFLLAWVNRVYLDFGRVYRYIRKLQKVREHNERQGSVQFEDDEFAVEEFLVGLVVDDGVHESHDIEELADNVAVRRHFVRLVVLQLDHRQQRDDEVDNGEEQRGVPGLGHTLQEALRVEIL
jgi:hypothetical protein